MQLAEKWQCGTWQVDFNLPGRFDSTYVGEDGAKHTPVLLHRAALGSFERFIGILLENYGGNLPLWLSPTQVVLATITDEAKAYADDIENKLLELGVRVISDKRNEQISYKVREHSKSKCSIILALGKKEVDEKTVSVRRLGSEKTEVKNLDAFIKSLVKEIQIP